VLLVLRRRLKKIDCLGLKVIENSGGQATTGYQRRVEVDPIGLARPAFAPAYDHSRRKMTQINAAG
jgi:hypothetical protein